MTSSAEHLATRERDDLRDDLDRALAAHDYLTAFQLRAKLLGLAPIEPYALGLHSAKANPNSTASAFDIRNPELTSRQDMFTRGGRLAPDYDTLVAWSRDRQNPGCGQARLAASQVATAAERDLLSGWVNRVGTAVVTETQLPQGGLWTSLTVYLPDGDVATGRATMERVEALRQANYNVHALDAYGKPDPLVSVEEMITFAAAYPPGYTPDQAA